MKNYHFIRYIPFTVICFTFSNVSLAQSSDTTAIHAAMNTQVKAWNNGDIDAFMQTYWKSDSLLFVGSKGPNYGWQNTLDSYKKRYPNTATTGKLDFEI